MPYLLLLSLLALVGCSSSFKLKQNIDQVDICPMVGFEPNPEVTALYWVMLHDLAKSNPKVREITCDKTDAPMLELRISGTHLAGSDERWRALGMTTLGVVTPVAMILAGFPIIIFWWDIPENQMVYSADLESAYETENVVLQRNVSTTSYSGSPFDQMIKQRDAFRKDLDLLVNQNFANP